MTIKFDPMLVETLKEQILDNESAQETVDQYATKCIGHLVSANYVLNDLVHEELFCQYQNDAWNTLFFAIATR